MNLFDILSAGKRDLNEENVSSFLAWLLDPAQSHGCGSVFLERILQVLDSESLKVYCDLVSNKSSLRKANPITVDVMVEEDVEAAGKTRYVDIVIIMTSNEKAHILAIENKIRTSAHDETQPKEEYEGLISKYADADVSFLYLTPSKTSKFTEAFNLLPDDIDKLHLSWAKDTTVPNEKAFVDIIRDILRDDSDATIDPLTQEVRFVLKSFILFAENGFRSQTDKESSVAPGAGNWKGTVAGIEGVITLFQEQKNAFIGFMGGIKELEKAQYNKIENRPFKWDDNLDGKKSSNWIPISKFMEIVSQKTED